MIVLIYILSFLYILAYFIHKFLKVLLASATELNRRINERILYNVILKALDAILQNTYVLLGAVIIFVILSTLIIIIYIYYRFALVPLSKIPLLGCLLYNTFSLYPLSEIIKQLKQIGIIAFFDNIIFSNAFVSDIIVNIVLESTIKYSVSKDMYNDIKASIIKNASFSIEDICGDTNENSEDDENKRGLTYEDILELKRKLLIKQCTNTQTQSYKSNESSNFTTGIKNKLVKNICKATYT